jgi:hypothetical protein
MIYTSQAIEEDGIVEIHLSLTHETTPLMKCRAVKDKDHEGKYIAIVRDYNTGILIDQSMVRFDDVEQALNFAVTSALQFLRSCIN